MLYSLIVYTVGMTNSLQTQKDIKCTWKKKKQSSPREGRRLIKRRKFLLLCCSILSISLDPHRGMREWVFKSENLTLTMMIYRYCAQEGTWGNISVPLLLNKRLFWWQYCAIHIAKPRFSDYHMGRWCNFGWHRFAQEGKILVVYNN